MYPLNQLVDYEETPIDQSYHPVLVLDKIHKQIRVRALGFRKVVVVRKTKQ